MLHKNHDHCPVRIIEPYPITHRFKVKESEDGMTLSSLMHEKFPFRSSDDWIQKIKKGYVGIENSSNNKPDQILKSGDRLFHHNPRVIEPAVPDEVRVISVSDEYLIAYKPAPMPVHPGGRYNKNTLTSILAGMGYEDLKVVHRLDAVTMGLILFARNKNTARRAMESFASGKVKKNYYALVDGVPEEDSADIDTPVRRKKGFVFESELGLKQAKEALTHFEVILRGTDKSIISCRPVTGRTHQIRLHLRQWGYPITDDHVYKEKDPGLSSPQKHAISLINAGLSIPDLEISAELPVPEKWMHLINPEDTPLQ
ncbi:pseudouridine synthase [Balneola sp. MJW-20]|uniref:pseudouridine synthase n=1 Tax=Gracilimonas aurantiaca TaxID=3234185 RepID=UPI003466E357